MLESPTLAADGEACHLTCLRNAAGMEVTFMDWGATWLSAQIPLANGSVREALLGCASTEQYFTQQAYLGATVGRCANRIRNAYLTASATQLVSNCGPHQLHGGPQGFSHRRWQTIAVSQQQIHYRLHSADGDQGFPGNVTVDLLISLSESNRLTFQFDASSDAATPLVLTNHAYFNLDATPGDARHHQLQLAAQQFQPVDVEGLPEGELRPVAESSFDFRQPKSLAKDFLQDSAQQVVGGYDHAFVLDSRDNLSVPAAHLTSQDGCLSMALYTSEPCLQLYTANGLAGTPARQGVYENYQGVALEPGYLPDAANQIGAHALPDCWLTADQTRQITLSYQFITDAWR